MCKRPPASEAGLLVCGVKTELFSPSVVYLAFFCEERRHGGLVGAACDLLIHLHTLVRAAL